MKATARFQTPWVPVVAGYRSPEPEVSADQVEAAMRTLAVEAAKRGKRTPLATTDLLMRPPLSAMQATIADPLGIALSRMEVALATYLSQTAGPVRAAAARDRIRDELFNTFDRPQIEASGPKQ